MVKGELNYGNKLLFKKRVNFHPLYSKDDIEEYPQQLINGWVWRNKYYPDVDTLNRDYEETFHIGKSSHGWKFLLCIYPEYNIKSLEDWKTVWSDKKTYILDEYDELVTPEELYSIILREHYSEEERKTLRKHNDIYISDDSNSTYDTTSFTEFW